MLIKGKFFYRQAAYLPHEVYTTMACIRALFSALSILVMGFVLLRLKLRVDERSAFVSDNELTSFRSTQRSFTRLMIASYSVTFGVFLLSVIIQSYSITNEKFGVRHLCRFLHLP